MALNSWHFIAVSISNNLNSLYFIDTYINTYKEFNKLSPSTFEKLAYNDDIITIGSDAN